MYPNESFSGCVIPDGTATVAAEVLTAATAVHGSYVITKQCKIKSIAFYVNVAVLAGTTAPQVRLIRRPTYGSATGQVVLGTLIIPNGAAVGSVIYKLINPVSLFPGDALTLEHTVQAADPGTPTGQGFYAFELVDDPEVVANQSKMIASA